MGDRNKHLTSIKHKRNTGQLPPSMQVRCVLCHTNLWGPRSVAIHEQREKHKDKIRGLPEDFVIYEQRRPRETHCPNTCNDAC